MKHMNYEFESDKIDKYTRKICCNNVFQNLKEMDSQSKCHHVRQMDVANE